MRAGGIISTLKESTTCTQTNARRIQIVPIFNVRWLHVEPNAKTSIPSFLVASSSRGTKGSEVIIASETLVITFENKLLFAFPFNFCKLLRALSCYCLNETCNSVHKASYMLRATLVCMTAVSKTSVKTLSGSSNPSYKRPAIKKTTGATDG